MDLWGAYKAKTMGDFSQSPVMLNTGDRKGTSLSMVEWSSSVLEVNSTLVQKYDEAHRYILAKDISFDLLVTAYDVNSRWTFAARVTQKLDPAQWKKLFGILGKVRPSNFEFRLIGMQNGYRAGLEGVELLHKRTSGVLAEADLFGTDTRHIAIDTKTGVSYNLLLLNRVYRPGELKNTLGPGGYDDRLQKLVFR